MQNFRLISCDYLQDTSRNNFLKCTCRISLHVLKLNLCKLCLKTSKNNVKFSIPFKYLDLVLIKISVR